MPKFSFKILSCLGFHFVPIPVQNKSDKYKTQYNLFTSLLPLALLWSVASDLCVKNSRVRATIYRGLAEEKNSK